MQLCAIIIGLMWSIPSLLIANNLYNPMAVTGHNYRNADVLL